MSAINIYDRLRAYGLSHAGACAMLGNFEAESALQANNLQNDYEKKLGFMDAMYTLAVNVGDYKNFVNDKAGYGLAQWTYGPRKKNLLEFAHKCNAPIDDENMQVDFAVHELKTEYSGLFNYLCRTNDLYDATERVCREFERPAVNNVDRRYEFALKWEKEFGDEEESNIDETPIVSQPIQNSAHKPIESILVLEAVLNANGYAVPVKGFATKQFCDTLEQFAKDVREVWGF